MMLLILDGRHLVTYAFMMENFWLAHTIKILLEFGQQIFRYSALSFHETCIPIFFFFLNFESL